MLSLKITCFKIVSFIRYWNYNNHGYGIYVDNLNWSSARSSALSSGGYLAEVNDVGENNFIKTILNPNKLLAPPEMSGGLGF